MEHRTRQVSYKDNQGNTRYRTEHYRVRVNTHYKKSRFNFYQWTDTSPDPSSIGYISELHLTRLKFYKVFSFTSYASYSFNIQKDHFLACHIRDRHYDFHVAKDIPGFRENVLIFNDTKGPMPWFCKRCNYVLAALFMLSWLNRIKFVSQSTKVTFTMRKMILN